MFGIFAVVLFTLLWFLRNIWASFYASDEEIKDELLKALPWFILGCLIFDGFQGSMSGTLKGIDKKNLVTYSTLIAYYVCGISDYLIFFKVFL